MIYWWILWKYTGQGRNELNDLDGSTAILLWTNQGDSNSEGSMTFQALALAAATEDFPALQRVFNFFGCLWMCSNMCSDEVINMLLLGVWRSPSVFPVTHIIKSSWYIVHYSTKAPPVVSQCDFFNVSTLRRCTLSLVLGGLRLFRHRIFWSRWVPSVRSPKKRQVECWWKSQCFIWFHNFTAGPLPCPTFQWFIDD